MMEWMTGEGGTREGSSKIDSVCVRVSNSVAIVVWHMRSGRSRAGREAVVEGRDTERRGGGFF